MNEKDFDKEFDNIVDNKLSFVKESSKYKKNVIREQKVTCQNSTTSIKHENIFQLVTSENQLAY